MTVWFISRHPGAKEWMDNNKIKYDHHITHLTDQEIKSGDTVIGSLPVNLAADICNKGAMYWNLSLEIPESSRGKELSANELNKFKAKLELFSIAKDKTNYEYFLQNNDNK